MRLSLFLPLLCLAIAAVPAAAQEGEAPLPRVLDEAALPGVMAKAVDDFIIPGYRDLSQSTAALAQASGTLCDTPSDATLGAARSAFCGPGPRRV